MPKLLWGSNEIMDLNMGRIKKHYTSESNNNDDTWDLPPMEGKKPHG